jgi:hypothetical protein
MANVDLLTAVGVATFGGGIFFGIILVVAAGIRAEGHLAWRRGAVTLQALRGGRPEALSSAA